MATIKIPIRTVFDNSNNPLGLAEFQTGEVVGIEQGGTSANTVSDARINLSVDDSNIRSLFSTSGDLSYDSSTGVFSFTNDLGDIESVTAGNGLTGGGTTGNVTLDIVGGYGITVNSDNIELTNNQITALVTKSLIDELNVDADTLDGLDSSAFALDTDLTTANVAEVTNLYYTDTRAFANLIAASTSSLQEGTNLYYTDTRAFANLITASTTSLQEGTNLYFTNTRAVAALAGQNVSIGEATITGNLFVLGNVVEFNTETLVIEDKNIVLANGSPSASASNNSGITVDGSNASILYKSDEDQWLLNKNLEVEGSIDASGQITSPFFYSESDISLKENIEPINNPIQKVLELLGVSFYWKTNKQKSIGVIAQNVEKVLPEIVSNSTQGTKTVSYDSLIPLLIEAIKEQQKQIEELKLKVK